MHSSLWRCRRRGHKRGQVGGGRENQAGSSARLRNDQGTSETRRRQHYTSPRNTHMIEAGNIVDELNLPEQDIGKHFQDKLVLGRAEHKQARRASVGSSSLYRRSELSL